MKIGRVERTSLVGNVVDRIRHLIATAQLKPGERLPSETSLVKELQVSRPVVREAISKLEGLGLVEVGQGRGIFVGDAGTVSSCARLIRSAMEIAPKDLHQYNEFRRMFECFAARLAAVRATPAQIDELEALCETLGPATREFQDIVLADCEFHRKLAEMTRNEILINLATSSQEFLMAEIWHTTHNPKLQKINRACHLAIVKGIRARNPDEAEKAMHRHMDNCDQELSKLAPRV